MTRSSLGLVGRRFPRDTGRWRRAAALSIPETTSGADHSTIPEDRADREGNPGLVAPTQTTELWLGSWLLTIGLLTVLTLRLPWTYPALLGVVDVALVLLLIGTAVDSRATVQAGGVMVFVFVAFAVYHHVASPWEEMGGASLPLGKPLVG